MSSVIARRGSNHLKSSDKARPKSTSKDDSTENLRTFIESRLSKARELHLKQMRLIHELLLVTDRSKWTSELAAEIVAVARHEHTTETFETLTNRLLENVSDEWR